MAPGVNPPAGIESDEMSRATPGANAGTFRGSIVGICEGAPIACPQDEQKRLLAGTSAEHEGHCMAEGGMGTGAKGRDYTLPVAIANGETAMARGGSRAQRPGTA